MSTLKNFRNSLIGATCVALLATASHAADVVAAKAPLESGFNWSGLYVGFGGGVGAVVLRQDLGFGGFDGTGGEGLFGVITVGYDYMVTDRLLVGAFADARVGNVGDASFVFVPGVSIDGTYGFDAGLRLGYLVTPQTLAYALGGYSWQHFDLKVDGDTEYDWGAGGYVIGLGLETVLHSNWTLKTEYRYSHYAGNDLDTGGFFSVEPRNHTFHAGLNYRFNGSQTKAGFETPAYNWTGFYIGVAAGAGALVEDREGILLAGFGGDGVLGEISVGYDREFANGWVAGMLADARLSNIRNEFSPGPGFAFVTESDYGFDVLARIGKKVNDSTLAYVLGGYSWQHLQFGFETPAGDVEIADEGSNGFSIGGGLETAFSTRTTVNLEYRYSQFQENEESILAGEPSLHTVRIGAKYKFN